MKLLSEGYWLIEWVNERVPSVEKLMSWWTCCEGSFSFLYFCQSTTGETAYPSIQSKFGYCIVSTLGQ
jgi:hypothetical protein